MKHTITITLIVVAFLSCRSAHQPMFKASTGVTLKGDHEARARWQTDARLPEATNATLETCRARMLELFPGQAYSINYIWGHGNILVWGFKDKEDAARNGFAIPTPRVGAAATPPITLPDGSQIWSTRRDDDVVVDVLVVPGDGHVGAKLEGVAVAAGLYYAPGEIGIAWVEEDLDQPERIARLLCHEYGHWLFDILHDAGGDHRLMQLLPYLY